MRNGRRMAGWAAAIVMTATLGWLLFRPRPIEVETVRVAEARLMVTVGDEGETRVQHRHAITAPVPGRLARITLEPGDTIAAGAVVARLAPLPLDARSREQAVAALAAAGDRARGAAAAAAQARTALEQARQDRQRAERLVEGGAIARAEFERLERLEAIRAREVEAARAQQGAAEHDVAVARSALMAAGTAGEHATLALTCPVGGVVLAVPEMSERTVPAGELLLEVGDPADLEIAVDLLSTEAVRVQAGQPMLVTGWGGRDTLRGRVRRVDPGAFTKISALGVEEQRVTVRGDLLDSAAALGDRFRVDVQVVLWRGERVRQLPASALFRRGQEWAVFVIEGGRARERVVTVGHEGTDAAEILSGVAPDIDVIRQPTDRIADGVRVRGRD